MSVTFSPVISSELITKEAATLFQEAEKEKEKKEETETIAVDQVRRISIVLYDMFIHVCGSR